MEWLLTLTSTTCSDTNITLRSHSVFMYFAWPSQ